MYILGPLCDKRLGGVSQQLYLADKKPALSNYFINQELINHDKLRYDNEANIRCTALNALLSIASSVFMDSCRKVVL